ncbi:hypothetical protein [Spirosoma validum]|uniref:Uncharacterized protein n=1 Tax=Spirosoma validum TaxID=2771355 RepID=A0A927GGT6_9BACT|nr:hypothetical protein [Spirosoma validum]MBD2757224.1 hypothetical protein [Spirosoma validum]
MDQQDHTPTPALIAIAAMLELHLSNWQELLLRLQTEKAPSDRIKYYKIQIERLEAESIRLSETASWGNSADYLNKASEMDRETAIKILSIAQTI